MAGMPDFDDPDAAAASDGAVSPTPIRSRSVFRVPPTVYNLPSYASCG